jgi:hypothetical protein
MDFVEVDPKKAIFVMPSLGGTGQNKQLLSNNYEVL